MAASCWREDLTTIFHRHGRACPGHPRLASRKKTDVDARDKRGHDEEFD
jgi:hypothetical protein